MTSIHAAHFFESATQFVRQYGVDADIHVDEHTDLTGIVDSLLMVSLLCFVEDFTGEPLDLTDAAVLVASGDRFTLDQLYTDLVLPHRKGTL